MSPRPRRSASIEKLLGPTETPAFVVTARRAIAWFNAGCERLTGWPAGEAVGTRCDYAEPLDPSDVGSVAAALCPPPEAFAGSPACVAAHVVHRDGRSFARRVHYFPLLNDEGKTGSVLGVITPLGGPKPAVTATASQRLHAELAAMRHDLRQRFGLRTIVARAPAMLRALRQAQLARTATAPVLLRGEPGTGREHLARAIHFESELRPKSFVPLDCRRLPAFELKQALRRLVSRDSDDRDPATLPPFLQPGTVYLKDVDALPRDVQELLATALKGDPPPVRVMASTSADLQDAVRRESFLPDLYFALTPIEIVLPALRERRDDLPLLAQAFLEEANRGAERQLGGFSEDVVRQFAEYNWPGNLDELHAVAREARERAAGPLIQPADLPFRFRAGQDAQSLGPAFAAAPTPLELQLEQFERERIEAALELVRHNKSRAAELLGMPRPKLYRRMESLGIRDEPEST